MKKTSILLAVLFIGTTLWAMPSQITFQGTLKQQGVPVTGTENMQFSFVDATGAGIPGTTPVSVANVQVTNGLFAVQLPLDPTIPWEQYSPFIQVSVQGQILSPNQPLNANLYAVAAIPQGMIMMSTSTCPSGWIRFSALDNMFPMGGADYGVTGGAATHTHMLVEGQQAVGGAPEAVGAAAHGGPMGAYPGGNTFTFFPVADATTSASNLPPYVTMIFCQKT